MVQSAKGTAIIHPDPFFQEIVRLRALLHQGYLQKDSTISTIAGVTFKPRLMNFPTDDVTWRREAQILATLGLNTVRVDGSSIAYTHANFEAFLNEMSSHGITTHFITQHPWDGVTSLWHYDPFDTFSVADWQAKLQTSFLNNYADDDRISTIELINEPLIKQAHYPQMIELGQWAQQQCPNKKVTIALDVPDLVGPLAPAINMITFHVYGMSYFKSGLATIQQIADMLRVKLSEWKIYGNPILIGETGFPTYLKYPSNQGHSPYLIPDITDNTPETEELQYDYLANILHVIKETNILGYLIYQWTDDLAGGQGGFGLKTQYPTLSPKKAIALLP